MELWKKKRKQEETICCPSVWSAGWLTSFFTMNRIHNLHDFPPFLAYVQQMVQRGPVQHSSQLCYSADSSRFVCWKERLPKGYPHIWTDNLYKAAQLVSDPLTVKNISYDSHHFHTSDKNIQSDPYLEASVLSFSLFHPPPTFIIYEEKYMLKN